MTCWLALTAVALATPSAPQPTEAEWGKLVKGEVVTRSISDLDPPGAYGWVEIAAQSDDIWAVLNDPAEAVAGSSSVSSCEKYRDEPGPGGTRFIGLHYVLNVAWSEVEYHTLRQYHPDQQRMTWVLDPERQHDLVSSTGFYQLTTARTDGKVLLAYQSQADSGRNVPQWIVQMLSGKALKGYLGRVQASAEER